MLRSMKRHPEIEFSEFYPFSKGRTQTTQTGKPMWMDENCIFLNNPKANQF